VNRNGAPKRVKTLPEPPPRPDDSHKGSFGHVLVVAGHRGMSGAACLVGLGALRGGAGLVTVAVPAGVLPIVAAVEPSYLTLPLPEDEEGRISRGALERLDHVATRPSALAVGPGIGQSAELTGIVSRLFSTFERPAVFDADALNLLAASGAALSARKREREHVFPRVLTPHPGEFARLTGTTTVTVQKNRESLAVEFAARHQLVLLLKGYHTVITDGQRVAINTTGNSGMATGGSGDVLTGIIAALLAQGMEAFEAAQLGAYLHGLAGDLAAESLSKPGLIASDLPRWLGEAWRTLSKAAPRARPRALSRRK
jgi:ADP-dependent NAD(P)H-hydrate dehydratase